MSGCTTPIVIEVRDAESNRPLSDVPLTVHYWYMLDVLHLHPDEFSTLTDESGRAYVALRTAYPASFHIPNSDPRHPWIPIETPARPGHVLDDRFARDDFRNAPRTSRYPTEPGPEPWLPWVRYGPIEVLVRPPNPDEKSKFD